MPGNDHAGSVPEGRGPLREHRTEDIIVPATPAQQAYLADLKRRAGECLTDAASAARRRSQGIPGNAPPYILSVLHDERMANTDLRLAGQPMDGPGKIAAAAARITGQARRTRGLQVLFCEIDVYRACQADLMEEVPPSWDIEALIAGELSARRIAARRIRFASWPGITERGAAAELDAACRDGTVRVLVCGRNVIERVPAVADLVAGVHHLDVPFDTADAQQRDAVLARADLPAVRQFRYMTSGYTEADGWRAISHGAGPVQAAQDALTGTFSASGRRPPDSPPAGTSTRRSRARPPAGKNQPRRENTRRHFPK